MIRFASTLPQLTLAAALLHASHSLAQNDPDPLNLQMDPPAESQPASNPLRVAIELGVGRIELSNGDDRNAKRASFDLRYRGTPAPGWRFELSNRFDYLEPELLGQGRSSNSLREAFVAWQRPGEALSVDAGRINLRQGPAFGFNPTDYFRQGALRTATTVDPVALRERRLGTVMLRGGWLWNTGSASLALAPKLTDDGPVPKAASLDLGATNNVSRALLSASQSFGESFNTQASAYVEDGGSAQLGLSVNALLGDSLVAYGEFSGGRMRPVLDRVLPGVQPMRRHAQAAVGFTYTFPSALALTLEADYNGAGMDDGGWQRLTVAGPQAVQHYFTVTQSSQELGSRHGWLVYASQKGLGLKQLDLTAFVRGNSVDDSRLLWAELRYHWQRIDGVLQWQRSQGNAGSEYGVLPVKQAMQLSAVLYF